VLNPVSPKLEETRARLLRNRRDQITCSRPHLRKSLKGLVLPGHKNRREIPRTLRRDGDRRQCHTKEEVEPVSVACNYGKI